MVDVEGDGSDAEAVAQMEEEESDSGEEVELSSTDGEGEDSGEDGDGSSGKDEDEEGEDEVEEVKGQGSDEEEEVEKEEEGISGWADSIAKILKSTKPKNKKEMMLSRARKDYEVNRDAATRKKVIGGRGGKTRVQDDELEIIPLDKGSKVDVEGDPDVEGDDDTTTNAKKDAKSAAKKKKDDKLLSLKVQRKLELKQKKLELAWENLARMQAEKTDPELERDLVKMATKGVVQLFNAISMQQKTIKSKLKSSEKSEFKKDKVLHQTKDIFDNAMSKSKRLGNNSSVDVDVDEAVVKKEEVSSGDEDDGDEDDIQEIGGATVSIKINSKRKATTPIISDKHKGSSSSLSKKKPVWNALQDDFMLDAKLKDWDKDSDDD